MTLIDVSKLTSYYYNKKIVFLIQIPLISPTKYIVYKLIPLPTPHNSEIPNTFALIHPSKSYLAITDDRLHYALLDNLKECSKLTNDDSICPLTNVYSTSTNPSCETRLLTEVVLSLPIECDSKLLYGNINIWQKLRNNKWIFVQSKSTKLNVRCNNDIKDYSIVGTGILELRKNCIAYCKTFQFIPSTTSSFTEILNKSIPLLSPLSLSNIDLDSLKQASHQLDGLEHEINKFQQESHFVKYAPYYSGFSLSFVSLIIIYLCYRLYFCFQNRNKKSTCCVQIFNQCYNNKNERRQTKLTNSIEMSDISTSENEDDKKSIKSLPARHFNYKSCRDNNVSFLSTSNRNLNF
ncbi:uncharacterized protein LOC113229467 [Hyposmocoma kahamanoa]|uniref:uncharacterized protein LOC113229467 n=1 Tax=Hyposmocoma kahamanoa TaxID=1477025 RepID=UPI000E6D8E84|nr:uncharacterized protein LOC113229467 [Hyposmocoma kahamanoa]